MLRVRAFEAVRPMPNAAAHVASLPYDVVTTEEARRLAQGEPTSFLHVVRPEIDLPPGTDPHDEAVYDRARANFDRLLADGVIFHDRRPTMFLYRQVLEHRTQIGLVCCCHVDDYASGVIRKHENTRPDKEDDRTRHLLALEAHVGPVFMAFRDHEEIDALVFEDTNERPLYHFNAPDGVTHTVWEARDPQRYADVFGGMPAAYVADGHHRAASAVRAAETMRRSAPGEGEWDWFLAVLFPASQLAILPYNRTVADLGGRTAEEIRAALAGAGTLTATDAPSPERPGIFCVYLDGAWHRLELDPGSIDRGDPVASLDVSLLQTRILEPILGVGDPRTDARLQFVGGIRGTDALARRVDAGEAAIAFSLHATSIEQLLDVADAGLIMPPKSTWFEPKLRSGLFVHTFR
ncbi:MAG: DUF1015 domain-containing protein [Planctomycetota bacterium]|jgi:uncharacterized protein (DUF1015 family)